MSIDWIGWLRDLRPDQHASLISVLATEGSAPRGAGTRMLVTAGGFRGTIGGGALEHRAAEQARQILAQPTGAWRVQDYPLGPLLGQCCGGRVRLLIEHVDATALGWLDEVGEGAMLVSTLETERVARRIAGEVIPTPPSARGERPLAGASFTECVGARRRPICLFGAGHVGQAIARHARSLPLSLAWFDTRPELAGIEGVTIVDTDAVESCVADAPADAAVVILTHDHALDYRLSRAALTRSQMAFVGLIGSATKRARFLSRLESEGLPEEARARLTCPIGVAGVAGKEPDVIAVALLAQLFQLGPP